MKERRKILSRIKEVVLQIDADAEIFLFGSQARGDSRRESDWDVLILVPHATDLKEEQKFRHKLLEVELQFGIAISTMLKSKEEWNARLRVTPLFQNIKQEGIQL